MTPNQYQKSAIVATTLFFLIVILTTNSFSGETANAAPVAPQAEALPVLPQVTVTGERIAPMTGATILDREMIENLPARNGTLNELIGIVPGVQHSEEANSSFTAGEITPPGVSISGSRFYENNFTIDGFSNNSALDPAQASGSISILPGHPQKIFLDPHLIEQITVYDSNIPAEHGDFTGGMVAAETLDPVDGLWGNLNYRTTRDSWTHFHIDPDDQDDFELSATEAQQPRFKKQDGGFLLNSPIGSRMGILASYQRLQSDIPLTHFGTTKDQTRLSENFFLKYGYHITNRTRLYLTGIHAPNENEYFGTGKNSDYRIESATSSATAQFEKDFVGGSWQLNAGFSYLNTEKDAPLEKFKWDTGTPSIDWDNGLEGETGPLYTSQQDIEIKSSFSFREFSSKALSHQAKVGLEAEHSRQSYERPLTAYYYTDSSLYPAVVDPTIACNGVVACIDNEQYLLQRYVYEQGSSTASYYRYAAFVQDAMSWRRLELFPGVRISHDSITENTNIAPRFATSYDLFGNRKTILFGGANRYYSGSLLTYQLREAISASGRYETRSDLAAEFVTANDGLYLWAGSDLKTPYSDEITLGVIQSAFGGELKLQYTERSGRDELARERTDTQPDGFRYYLLNNNGRTEHESYQFIWGRSWRRHYLEVNGTYQQTTTSNPDYHRNIDADDLAELIWYNGRTLSYAEIPRSDFNRPTVINLIYSGQLPLNTTFTNTAKYRDAYYRLKYIGKHELPSGEEIFAYEKDKNHSSIRFDWRFAWAIPMHGNRTTVLTLDIYNVFNEKAPIAHQDDEFEIGRQYWAGVEFNF
jgi:hypothetical protein